MADISALFDDVLFPVEIKDKRTGEPVGLTIWIAPFDVDETANMWFRSRFIIESQKAKGNPVDPDIIADIATKADIRRVVASIRKWDWHGQTAGIFGKDPECTDENKAKILSHPSAGFIIDQLIEAGNDSANFTKKPEAI